MKKWLCFIWLLIPIISGAQDENPARAILSSDSIQLGEQVDLTLSLTYHIGTDSLEILWPKFQDTIIKEIEILKLGIRDTSLADPENDELLFVQNQKLTITAFEAGFFAIPPLSFVLNGNVFDTSPLLLSVYAPEIAAEGEFKDIKDIKEIDVTWWDFIKEHWMWFVIGLVLIVAATLALVLVKSRKADESEPDLPVITKAIPPHEEALIRLKKLREGQYWQKGLVKEYYIQMTDIVRTYIERRYMVLALEETTPQIIGDLRRMRIDPSQVASMQQVLELADLVKFAKAKPISTDHELCIQKCEDFIHQTKETVLAEEI
jgi:hypothetical protein